MRRRTPLGDETGVGPSGMEVVDDVLGHAHRLRVGEEHVLVQPEHSLKRIGGFCQGRVEAVRRLITP
jgi:hypothetical protein